MTFGEVEASNAEDKSVIADVGDAGDAYRAPDSGSSSYEAPKSDDHGGGPEPGKPAEEDEGN